MKQCIIPGSRLLISSLAGSALRTHAESLDNLAMSTSVLKALPGKLDIKRHSPSILYVLTLNALNDSSFWFNVINFGRSVVYTEGSQMIISN